MKIIVDGFVAGVMMGGIKRRGIEMGNKFGNYATQEIAEAAIIADGFKRNDRGYFTKASTTGGNLMEEPRECTAIVEITSYRVSGECTDDGKDYLVYQHHFI